MNSCCFFPRELTGTGCVGMKLQLCWCPPRNDLWLFETSYDNDTGPSGGGFILCFQEVLSWRIISVLFKKSLKNCFPIVTSFISALTGAHSETKPQPCSSVWMCGGTALHPCSTFLMDCAWSKDSTATGCSCTTVVSLCSQEYKKSL